MALPVLPEQTNGRCSGHCCRRFCLPYGPTELLGTAAWERRSDNAKLRGEPPPEPRPGEKPLMDGRQIAEMVVYLGYGPTDYLRAGEWETREYRHIYTCRNLQADGSCGIYATRPRMCSDFPYGNRCDYAGCTWTGVNGEAGSIMDQREYENDGRLAVTVEPAVACSPGQGCSGVEGHAENRE